MLRRRCVKCSPGIGAELILTHVTSGAADEGSGALGVPKAPRSANRRVLAGVVAARGPAGLVQRPRLPWFRLRPRPLRRRAPRPRAWFRRRAACQTSTGPPCPSSTAPQPTPQYGIHQAPLSRTAGPTRARFPRDRGSEDVLARPVRRAPWRSDRQRGRGDLRRGNGCSSRALGKPRLASRSPRR